MKAGNGKEKITGELQGAINQLRSDLNKVELWASALTVFSKPVPQYDLDQQRHQLPHALSRDPGARES